MSGSPSAEEALRRLLRPGDTLFVTTGVGEPAALIEALVAVAPEVGDLSVIQVMTGGAERLAEASGTGFRLLTPVPGPAARRAIAEGRADLLMLSMGQLAAGLASGHVPVDGALLSAAPPDGGRAPPGAAVDCGPLAFEGARFRALEINVRQPGIGGPAYDLSAADVVIETDRGLSHEEPPAAAAEDIRIAAHVAEVVPDGATLELGVGQALAAVPAVLSTHRDLAMHTGLLDDGTMALVACGAVARPLDSRSPVVAIGTVARGSPRLYRWLEDNPLVALRDSREIQSAEALARRTDLVAVNGAFQVDLLGQANSIGFGRRILGGIGGALDFATAGARGIGSVIALRSTSADGRSRIAAAADWVSLPMPLVTHVVTEWGVARLRGKPPAARLREMLGVAHPHHRAALQRDARALGLVA